MWKFNPFTQKEPAGLEGRYVDVGNIKVHVRNAIAEGGFSCVYLARDAVHASKQYALKHMICNDGESLDLVMKEISVMKLLQGHPNIVTLVAHTILDMGRTKEALLVMEFCDKSLVSVLENRGAGYFEEKQILSIFRDVCNAVFAMHCRSPPIAHRDLKAENVLLGCEGAWKLCDFGSTSTNHKCFDRPEEMGIEEDNIRKLTTPAYRAPEMWDLYRREVLSEKVDIWALGCLLYRICYLNSAFDGESKLQILNGNYRIPELPKYNASITGLIKDMLQDSPDARPDITQVWFRVNEQLPGELQKNLPDGLASATDVRPYTAKLQHEGVPKKTNAMPQRTPPPPPLSREQVQNTSPQPQGTLKAGGGGGGPIGAFWSTHHAQPKDSVTLSNRTSPQKNSIKIPDSGPTQALQPKSTATSQNKSSNTFVADFDASKLNPANTNSSRSGKEDPEAEVNRLKEQLKLSNLEKAEITSKYEKLSAICRSQRQEIQELKRALAAATLSQQPSKDISKSQISPGSSQSATPQRDKTEGSIWELEQGMLANCSAQPWQAFAEEPKAQPTPHSKPSAASPSNDFWAFGQDCGFSSATPSSQVSRTSVQGNTSQRFGSSETKKAATNQPVGWAGF